MSSWLLGSSVLLLAAWPGGGAGVGSGSQTAPPVPESNGAIAFTSRLFDLQIALMHTNGRGQRVLQRHPYPNLQPAISRDGSRLAFVSNRGGNADIWVAPAAGGAPTRLTTSPSYDYDPAWSPDGRQIVFNRTYPYGIAELFVMDADGRGAARITAGGIPVDFPDWQPSPK